MVELRRLSKKSVEVLRLIADGYDLQLDPTSPNLRFHRLDRPRDPNFWSVHVNTDVRLIVHKTATSVLLCYVGHHDAAYGWAERRRIERHPTTGAAQLVELPERVEAAMDPRVDPRIKSGDAGDVERLLFAGIADDRLLAYGVPIEWLDPVRQATEDTLFAIAERLPQEAAEAWLELATGTTPEILQRTPIEADPFAHPDAQRRFRVLTNIEELERALDYPWDSGRSFCIRVSGDLSSVITADPPGSAEVPALERRSWRYTGR
jgi:hypothetical protein